MELTFEKSMEILEITDISKVNIGDLLQIEKKAKKRWHPDKVIHLNNTSVTHEYTVNFQLIEGAVKLVQSYLNGTFEAGEAFREHKERAYHEPEEVIRENAYDIQVTLKDLWNEIKQKKYKWHQEEVIVSKGFRLKDILIEDFNEDIAMLSVVSFFYGSLSLGLLSALLGILHPLLSAIGAFLWLLQTISCILGMLPLSRFWLPQSIQDIMFKLINIGLKVFYWAEQKGLESEGPWVSLLVMIPVLFAKLVKYVILLPIYEMAKIVVRDKVTGVVKRNVNYYANAADWYIEELMNKKPLAMNKDELFHLSIIYNELSDVKQFETV